MPLTADELQTVIDLVDARLERQYNEEYQTILDKLTEFQWRNYGSWNVIRTQRVSDRKNGW